MLSRTAEMFYWMGRYIERAEYTSRMIDVHYDIHLERADQDEPTVDWEHYLESRGELETFKSLYPETKTKYVLAFMVFNEKNSNALVNLIKMARENARSIQDQLTSEAWHHLNGFHLSLKYRTEDELFASPHQLLYHITSECYTLGGVFRSTMLRDEGWIFYRLGKNIERPGHTARLLMHPVFLSAAPNVRALFEIQQCIAILKSASAYQSYRRVYGGDLLPKKIVQFLLFHDRFPRSVRFSACQVRDLLAALSGPAQNTKRRATERFAGQLVADLEYSSFEEVYQIGLSTFISEALKSLDRISDGLGQVFFRSPGISGQLAPAFHRRLRPIEMPNTQIHINKAVLSVRHRFAYRYEDRVKQVRTLMRLAPPQHYGRQQRLDIRWHLDPSADYRHFTDAFGNLVWQLDHADIKEMSCTVEMRVETHALYNLHGDLLPQGVLPQESDCRVDPVEFTRLTHLVDDSPPLAQWVGQLRSRRIHAAEITETVMQQVGAHMRYEVGRTGVETRASEAFSLGRGVCQDYTHIMLSLCRQVGMPARYVSGYLSGEGQMHAWVEVLLPVGPQESLTWVSYDPTHQCRCDERYITVGIGRDYQDIAPTSGFYSGEAASSLDSKVSVSVEFQGPADRMPTPVVMDQHARVFSEDSQQ
ncbi:MAG: alpha-E domain-containing protein [Nitrospiria bacterium]